MVWPFRSRPSRVDPQVRFERFRDLLDLNASLLRRIAEAEEMLGGEFVFDRQYLIDLAEELSHGMDDVVVDLNAVCGNRYLSLTDAVERVRSAIRADLEGRPCSADAELVLPLSRIEAEMDCGVGAKAVRLAELRRRLDVNVPPGFAVTVEAWRRFVEAAGPGVDAAKILATPIPREIERAIRRATAELAREAREASGYAVRSSAYGEDGERSFAGQFRTLLNVPAEGVPAAWREVVASFHAPAAEVYRKRHGLDAETSGMAVLVLPMIEARAAGVLYSLDPAFPDADRIVVAAAPGLGLTAVEGGAVDRFDLSREAPHPLLARAIAEKRERTVPAPGGGTRREEIPEGERREPSLTEKDLARLARLALRIERVLRFAVDLEWAVDPEGTLHVLQVRPLLFPEHDPVPVVSVEETRRRHRVLLEGEGEIACRGIGAGEVVVVPAFEECPRFPAGAILVAREATPLLAPCVARAGGVLTDSGGTASHLGTVAREFGVPAIFGTGRATRVLAPGTVVTVDAEEGIVYEGEVRELLRRQLLTPPPVENSREFRILRKMLRRIAPLNLVDPSARTFSPEGCRTYHDVLRFAHEKAVESLTEAIGRHGRSRNPNLVRLELGVPLDLYVLDTGGGLRPGPRGDRITPADLACVPLKYLVEGLTEPGVWARSPSDLDLRGFMSSALRGAAVSSTVGGKVERNVAVVTRDYVNLNLKLGYHFNVLNCRLREDPGENHLFFFFVGGVTEMERRARRAALIGWLLSARGYTVETRGDLVVGRLAHVPAEKLAEEMRVAGRLIGFTRQLDVHLRSDEIAEEYMRAFLEGKTGPEISSGESADAGGEA